MRLHEYVRKRGVARAERQREGMEREGVSRMRYEEGAKSDVNHLIIVYRTNGEQEYKYL